jgi:hypothetical protein
MARCQFGNLLCHAAAATGRSGDGTPTGWAMGIGQRARVSELSTSCLRLITPRGDPVNCQRRAAARGELI